jgi:hypothetical protein
MCICPKVKSAINEKNCGKKDEEMKKPKEEEMDPLKATIGDDPNGGMAASNERRRMTAAGGRRGKWNANDDDNDGHNKLVKLVTARPGQRCQK